MNEMPPNESLLPGEQNHLRPQETMKIFDKIDRECLLFEVNLNTRLDCFIT